MVTDLIVQRLEAGVVPWQMPWKSSNAMPRNLVSKKAYRGFNFWYLLSFNFDNPLFLTFNQVKQTIYDWGLRDYFASNSLASILALRMLESGTYTSISPKLRYVVSILLMIWAMIP